MDKKQIRVYIHTQDANDENTRVASILRRCALDAKRMADDLEKSAELVRSGRGVLSVAQAEEFKRKLLALNIPAV